MVRGMGRQVGDSANGKWLTVSAIIPGIRMFDVFRRKTGHRNGWGPI